MRLTLLAHVAALAAALALIASPAAAQLRIDLEGGAVWSGYNDVRIPGDTGTLFSLSEDLEIDPSAFWRARVEYTFGGRHTLSALAAPLEVEAMGRLGKDVDFEGTVFPEGTDVVGTYRFDSYRLTYRYEFAPRGRFQAGLGFTAKIRDAEVAVRSEEETATKTNTGFVPLLNFSLRWSFTDRASFLLRGDALAAPQGRAEDVLAAFVYEPRPGIAARIGYRIVEGGADNDEVYNFALLNYATAGLTIEF